MRRPSRSIPPSCSACGFIPTCIRWCGRCSRRPPTRSGPAARSPAREPLNLPNTETSFAELESRLANTIEYIKGFKPAQIDGTEDKEIVLKFGSNERKFSGQGLLLNHVLPNFYFHCTTAYDILRHCGVELGKRDFMGTPVNL